MWEENLSFDALMPSLKRRWKGRVFLRACEHLRVLFCGCKFLLYVIWAEKEVDNSQRFTEIEELACSTS